MVLDGEGIWVKTGGETTSGDASATTTDTAATEAQAAVTGSQSDQQNSKTDATKNSSDKGLAAQTDQPNMYPKVTLEFESNTLALNEYIDGSCMWSYLLRKGQVKALCHSFIGATI